MTMMSRSFPYETELWYLQPVKQLKVYQGLTRRIDLLRACNFLSKVARKLDFPFRTIATARLYFHLFFYRRLTSEPAKEDTSGALNHTSGLLDYRSDILDRFPPMDIALTALLVASKAEETYKRIRQILSAAFLILNPQFSGSELDVRIVEEHRQRVIQYEHLLLEAIEYNFAVGHAHLPLLALLRSCSGEDLKQSRGINYRKPLEWLHRCYNTPVILFYPPEIVALAAIFNDEAFTGEKGRPSTEKSESHHDHHHHNRSDRHSDYRSQKTTSSSLTAFGGKIAKRLRVNLEDLRKLLTFVCEYHEGE